MGTPAVRPAPACSGETTAETMERMGLGTASDATRTQSPLLLPFRLSRALDSSSLLWRLAHPLLFVVASPVFYSHEQAALSRFTDPLSSSSRAFQLLSHSFFLSYASLAERAARACALWLCCRRDQLAVARRPPRERRHTFFSFAAFFRFLSFSLFVVSLFAFFPPRGVCAHARLSTMLADSLVSESFVSARLLCCV